jgi:hypothetical protein
MARKEGFDYQIKLLTIGNSGASGPRFDPAVSSPLFSVR